MTHLRDLLIFIFGFFLLPLNAQQTDSSIIIRSPYDVSDSLMFGWVPGYQHDSIPEYTGSSIFTTDYLPSGSYWDEDCDEEEVYLARLIHKEGDSVHWNLGVGRAGIIYSFLGPYGEGVPPQVHGSGDFNLAPWIDEVWQMVSVNSNLNNTERFPAPPGSTLATTVRSMPYFIHGAGAYRNDTMFAREPTPFYSPLMASWYNDQEKALYTTNWGTQAHIPSLHKSEALYTYKYKDLGNGIMENTLIIQNFGDVPLQYHNMPWGGVRASNLPQVWVSKPDHTLERSFKTFGGDDPGILSSLDLTGGYMIWTADGDSKDRPALAIVYGLEKHKTEYKNKYDMSFNRIRWGLTGNVERSYTVFVLNPKIDINKGNSFYYRLYYINGTLREVHEKAKKIADAADYGFIDADPEQAERTIIKSVDHFNALDSNVELFAEPVPDNVPIFLLENTVTGIRYMSPDLYHNVPTLPFDNPYGPSDEKFETYENRIVYRPYDGTIKYIRLLGYGVSSRDYTPDIRYKLLDSLVLDTTRVVIPDAYKKKIWIPVGSCDSCSVGLDPEGLPPGAVLYSDFGENRIYEAKDPLNLDYSHNVVNPAKSSVNGSHLTGKVVRQAGPWSGLLFEVPGFMDLTGPGIFRLRVYHESEGPIQTPCNIGMMLKNSGNDTTRLEKWQSISVANEWVEYTFSFHNNNPPDEYNQVWLFFSSPDNDNQAAGQTFYVDELTGPSVIIPEKRYQVTFRIKDLVTGTPLQDVSVTLAQLTQLTLANGETPFNPIGGNHSYRISHPGYGQMDSTLVVQKDTVVEILLTKVKNHILFHIYSDNQEMVLSGISVTFGGNEVLSGLNGLAFFDVYRGSYDYTISHPGYFPVESSLEVSSDTTVLIILVANQANIKFRVYSGINRLKDVSILLGKDSFMTNVTGIAQFVDLPRFEAYEWSASKEGYKNKSGTLVLNNDTTVNVNMNFPTHSKHAGLHGLTLYPNPVRSTLHFESIEWISRIEINDLRGVVIGYTEPFEKHAGFNMAGYPDGLYIVHIYRDGQKRVSLKVIKSE